VIISSEAKTLARRFIEKTSMITPIIYIGWWKGTQVNYRGPKGQVCWRTVEEARWRVNILDLGGYSPPKWGPQPCELKSDEFVVHLDDKARDTMGSFVVSAPDGKLSVVHEAI